jgi:hypothetical protein
VGDSAQFSTPDHAFDLIRGAFDMHVHAAPDVVPRICDDIQLAKAAAAAGMAGFLLKSHHGSTVERAYILTRLNLGVRVAGGLALNESVGGLNVAAVEVALQLGGRCIWMPTQSAANHKQLKGKVGRGLSVLDDDGRLLPVVADICSLIASADAILATGHLAVREILALVPAAKAAGVRRIVITHAELDDVSMPGAIQLELVRQGCYIEHSLISVHPAGGSVDFALIAQNIRTTGADRCVISTDYGQADNPMPPLGLLDFSKRLLAAGFSRQQVELMAAQNPVEVIGKLVA